MILLKKLNILKLIVNLFKTNLMQLASNPEPKDKITPILVILIVLGVIIEFLVHFLRN